MPQNEQVSTEASFPPLRLGIALFLLSSATVLFTLSLFKLLSFFIMPSLFFDLLFIGFPVGAFLGVRFFKVSPTSFRATLWVLQGVMALSVVATLACKHFDYLRAHLFDVKLHLLLVQMGTFTGLFIPFFCGYGLSEYLGYQIGRRTLARRMPVVYALYLFGAAFAYVVVQLALPFAGISRLLCVALLLVATSATLLSRPGFSRWILAGETVVLLGALTLPGALEAGFLKLYKGGGFQSTEYYRRNGYQQDLQEWGAYSLTEVMRYRETGEYAGFYNDLMQWEYAPPYGFRERSLGMIPINITPPASSIAIIGAGGGRQVRYALQPPFRFRRILALELEPAVIQAVRGPLSEGFGRVYEAPNVTVEVHEARGYMEKHSDARFDLIYLPSVGGYPQMMLEPGNMIRTLEAYRTLRDRLTDIGVLAIWYPADLDPHGILTRQYVRTLASKELVMKVRAFTSRQEWLILAARSQDTPLPSAAELESFLTEPSSSDDWLQLPPNRSARPAPFFVPESPHFSPISDNQPFLAGNVRHIFSLDQVYLLFGVTGSVLLLIAAVLLRGLRRTGDPRIPGRSYWKVAGLSLLIGANFLVFEHYLILALFKEIYVFHDALTLGAVSFLILSGLGSFLITQRLRPACQLVGALFVVLLLVLELDAFGLQPSAIVLVSLVAPVAFVTGSFFPALFEAAAHNPLAVFAMDAVGAALGSMIAFFLPIAFGFHVFFPVGAGLFLLTALATWLFFRRSSGS